MDGIKPLFSQERIAQQMDREDADRRHNDLLDIQKKQMKILEQQNIFTKILALGTVILAVSSFFTLFGLGQALDYNWKVGAISLILFYALGIIGIAIAVVSFAYLLALVTRVIGIF